MILVAIALCLLILLGIIENQLHSRALSKIPLRILVNGTRGKTTVTRMVASVLNTAGIRTFAKTTGSEARRIFPDGSECAYRKHRLVSMMEQLPFVRLAVKGKAQAIVVECMALRLENQRLMAQKLVKPHYVLMTNVFVDHVEEIGKTEEETVYVLANSIADKSTVIAQDERFRPYSERLLVPTEAVPTEAFAHCAFPMHDENLKLVLTLAKELHISQENAIRGILNAKPDIGMQHAFHAQNCRIWNAFAANDPASFSAALDECAQYGPYHLLFNHRKDRAYRLEAFAQALQRSAVPPQSIGVIGEDKPWAARYMTRITHIPAQAISDPLAWAHALGSEAAESQLLCAGNIKGEGHLFLDQLIKEAQANV
ncbi:MAG: poly-gamma-glutamate synthase PgsB [Clostridia bacterium]